MRVLMLHGINLNMFGKRDPAQYGTITLAEIDAQLKQLGTELGAEVECFQTNHEGEMVERIHQAFRDNVDAIAKTGALAIIQPGGSVKDEEVVKAADELGLSMVFTGKRHFRH